MIGNGGVTSVMLYCAELITPASPFMWWTVLYLSMAAFYLVVMIFFLVFSSAELLSWNDK